MRTSSPLCPNHVCYNFLEPTEGASAVASVKICEAENSDGYEAD
jgi:hypothetical protein